MSPTHDDEDLRCDNLFSKRNASLARSGRRLPAERASHGSLAGLRVRLSRALSSATGSGLLQKARVRERLIQGPDFFYLRVSPFSLDFSYCHLWVVVHNSDHAHDTRVRERNLVRKFPSGRMHGSYRRRPEGERKQG